MRFLSACEFQRIDGFGVFHEPDRDAASVQVKFPARGRPRHPPILPKTDPVGVPVTRIQAP